MDGITLQAIFTKATTTVDGGWVISFSCSQDEAVKITQLATMRETLLQLGVIPINNFLNNPMQVVDIAEGRKSES